MAVMVVRTGNNDRRKEYAAPFAMLKQLSSRAAIKARRNSHQLRAKKPSSMMSPSGWFSEGDASRSVGTLSGNYFKLLASR
jgi:hypothetical protein